MKVRILRGASVNDLVVANPTPLPILVYEGEEVLGAQQNRTFDESVLIAAGATVKARVSCVEAGRWAAFAAAAARRTTARSTGSA